MLIEDLSVVPSGFEVDIAHMIENSVGNYVGSLLLISPEDTVAVVAELGYIGGGGSYFQPLTASDVPTADDGPGCQRRVEFDASLLLSTADGRLDEIFDVVIIVQLNSKSTPTFTLELDFESLDGSLELADFQSEYGEVVGVSLHGVFYGDSLELSVSANHAVEIEPGVSSAIVGASTIFKNGANSACGFCSQEQYCEQVVSHDADIVTYGCQPSPESCDWSDGPICECIDESSICGKGADFRFCLSEDSSPLTIICESHL